MRQTLLRLNVHGHAAPKYIRHAAPLPPDVPIYSKFIAKTIGAVGIFWILYRIKNDGMVMLVCLPSFSPIFSFREYTNIDLYY